MDRRKKKGGLCRRGARGEANGCGVDSVVSGVGESVGAIESRGRHCPREAHASSFAD